MRGVEAQTSGREELRFGNVVRNTDEEAVSINSPQAWRFDALTAVALSCCNVASMLQHAARGVSRYEAWEAEEKGADCSEGTDFSARCL